MQELSKGDLVYSKEYDTIGIVIEDLISWEQDATSILFPNPVNGIKMCYRPDIFVKGDPVEVWTADGLKKDDDYFFYGPLLHNPKAKSKFTVYKTDPYTKEPKISYASGVKHRKERKITLSMDYLTYKITPEQKKLILKVLEEIDRKELLKMINES